MTPSEFEELLTRYVQGKCTEEEIQKIHLWFSELNEFSELDVTPEGKEAMRRRLDERMKAEMEQATVSRRIGGRNPWLLMAACIGLILVSFFAYVLVKQPASIHAPELTELVRNTFNPLQTHENSGNSLVTLDLPDGSRVTLLPGSAVRFSEKAFNGAKREIQLSGNAFFEVSPDSQRPFLVYSEDLVTHVMGTSFWVKDNRQSKTKEVEVVTGKVRVYPKQKKAPETEEVVLTAKQKATYLVQTGRLEYNNPEEEELVRVTETFDNTHILNFQNHTLYDIRLVLEQEYQTVITLGNEELAQCRFTGDVTGLTLEDVLLVLCKTIGKARYEVVGNQIVIYGKGCG